MPQKPSAALLPPAPIPRPVLTMLRLLIACCFLARGAGLALQGGPVLFWAILPAGSAALVTAVYFGAAGFLVLTRWGIRLSVVLLAGYVLFSGGMGFDWTRDEALAAHWPDIAILWALILILAAQPGTPRPVRAAEPLLPLDPPAPSPGAEPLFRQTQRPRRDALFGEILPPEQLGEDITNLFADIWDPRAAR